MGRNCGGHVRCSTQNTRFERCVEDKRAALSFGYGYSCAGSFCALDRRALFVCFFAGFSIVARGWVYVLYFMRLITLRV